MQLSTDPSSGPLAAAVAAEQSSALAQALAQLPAEQRDAFLLHVETGLSLEEVAGIAGVSFETTKSRVRYARMKLRDSLQEHT
jgi:RNA polymerase sigma-70 factor (ECF subfamily)